MGAIVALLRGVNVGGHNRIEMSALRALFEKLGLGEPGTYVQSGNVVCKANDKDLARLATRVETAIEKKFGFRPSVVMRTASEMREVVAQNPFEGRDGIEPSKLLVVFLAKVPAAEAREKVLK